jgi:transglutaminase-like putative cysteine protease
LLTSGGWAYPLLLWGFLVGGWFLMDRPLRHLPNWASSLIAVPIALYAWLEFSSSGAPLMTVILHTLGLLQIAKIVKAKTPGDLWTMFIISLLSLLVGALIAFDLYYFALCATWSALAMVFLNAVLLLSRAPGSIVVVTAAGTTVHRRTFVQAASTWIAVAAGMAVVFLFLPRDLRGMREGLGIRAGADSSAWQIGLMPPSERSEAVSGFSERVEVGSIGRILLDSSVALHLQLLQRAQPVHKPEDQIYLCGGRHPTFDGRTWSGGESGLLLREVQRGERVTVVTERVTDRTPRLFYLSPRDLAAGVTFSSRGERVTCLWRPWETKAVGPAVPATGALIALPDSISFPRYRALAERITSGARTDFERAQRIEEYLSTQFTYTLDLEWETNGDPIAEFLFVRRRGYCVYFASAMVVLLRALPTPIPSVLCVGYARPRWDESQKRYTFLKRNAHAWVEAYFTDSAERQAALPVPFDPTAAQREEVSATAAAGPSWSMLLRARLEGAMLNYDARRQRELVLGIWDVVRWMLTTLPGLVCFVLLSLGIAALARWRARRRQRVVQRVLAALTGGLAIPTRPVVGFYVELLRLLERRGFKRSIAQTPEELARASKAPAAERITDAYLRLRFAGVALSSDELSAVARDLATFR